MHVCLLNYWLIYLYVCLSVDSVPCARSPLQDSRLFGPRPWKILAATYETLECQSVADAEVRGNGPGSQT